MENRELDELIESIGRWIIEDEKKPGILNPVQIQQIAFSNGVLKTHVENTRFSTSRHDNKRKTGKLCNIYKYSLKHNDMRCIHMNIQEMLCV